MATDRGRELLRLLSVIAARELALRQAATMDFGEHEGAVFDQLMQRLDAGLDELELTDPAWFMEHDRLGREMLIQAQRDLGLRDDEGPEQP